MILEDSRMFVYCLNFLPQNGVLFEALVNYVQVKVVSVCRYK